MPRIATNNEEPVALSTSPKFDRSSRRPHTAWSANYQSTADTVVGWTPSKEATCALLMKPSNHADHRYKFPNQTTHLDHPHGC